MTVDVGGGFARPLPHHLRIRRVELHRALRVAAGAGGGALGAEDEAAVVIISRFGGRVFDGAVEVGEGAPEVAAVTAGQATVEIGIGGFGGRGDGAVEGGDRSGRIALPG